MFRTEDNEDLKNEIYHLKKQLTSTLSENHLLKVKIRKLHDEITKRDKQIDVLIDPRQSPNIRTILYEKSATYMIDMKSKNEKLQRTLMEKNAIIKRLQNNLEITKLYSNKFKKTKDRNECGNNKRMDLNRKSEQILNNEDFKSCSWTSDLQSHNNFPLLNSNRIFLESNTTSSVREQYRGLPREHLLSIIENLKSNHCSPLPNNSRKSSPESDLDRNDLLLNPICDSPHEEIQQLQQHFLEMLNEVDFLKDTIFHLENKQHKTEIYLKEKGDNVDKLAKEVKNLTSPKNKISKGRKSFNFQGSTITSNNHKIDRICLSANSTNEKLKECQITKRTKNKFYKPPMKDETIQVDLKKNEDKEIENNKYIEKDKIFITKKSDIDEVSDECDNESVAIN